MIEQNLTRLAEDLGLPSLAPKDSNGYFQISLKDDLTISIKDLLPGLSLSSLLGPVLNQNKEELLIYLMKANFLGQGTGEQILGMEPDEKFLTLSRSITYEVDYQKLKDVLEDFTNYLIYWKGEVKRMQAIQPTL